jgi:hypothetical protein
VVLGSPYRFKINEPAIIVVQALQNDAKVQLKYWVDGLEYRWFERPWLRGPLFIVLQIALAFTMLTPVLIVLLFVVTCLVCIRMRSKMTDFEKNPIKNRPNRLKVKLDNRKLKLPIRAKIENMWIIKNYDYELIKYGEKDLKSQQVIYCADCNDCEVEISVEF